MLVVKIELWPCGREAGAREIGRMYIANVGGTHRRGNYRVAVCRRGDQRVPHEISRAAGPKATRSGVVRDYPRLSYSVWRLIIRAARACFPEERGRQPLEDASLVRGALYRSRVSGQWGMLACAKPRSDGVVLLASCVDHVSFLARAEDLTPCEVDGTPIEG